MAVMEGTLSKWTNVMKGWQFRWFVLDDNAGLLSYYTSKEKMMKGVRRGCVRLRGAVIGIDDEDDSTFTITVDGKTFHFQARSSEERENWIRALEDTILRHAKRTRWDPSRPAATIQDFDKKLVEADAYLQIIIDQIKDLEVRMEKMSDEDKARCVTIHNHATNMLDSIKHSIVMLQIAKNMANPVNGIYRPPDTLPMSGVNSSAATPSPQQGLDASSLNSGILRDEVEDDEDDGLRMVIEVGAECIESRRQRTMPASSSRSSLSSILRRKLKLYFWKRWAWKEVVEVDGKIPKAALEVEGSDQKLAK